MATNEPAVELTVIEKIILCKLRAGKSSTIAKIQSSQTTTKRLADMGFVRGAVVKMIRPGKPCIVKIDGICVGLGKQHQESILLDQP